MQLKLILKALPFAKCNVDAFEVQKPTADELSKRVRSMNSELWGNNPLDDILHLYSGNALELLNDSKYNEKYDFIWISQVIHFMTPEEIKTLNQIFKKVLKPGGRVFASSNHINQHNNFDSQNLIRATYEQAKLNNLFCPGFVTINAAKLTDHTYNAASFTIVSAYNQEQMKFHSMPIKVNAYVTGYLGPTPKDTKLPKFDEIKAKNPNSIYNVEQFYQVLNLFDPETAQIVFMQSGFEVVSFNWDGGTGKKPISNDRTNIATVILLQKNAEDSSSIPNIKSSKSLSQISGMFEPSIDDKLLYYIEEINDKSQEHYSEALNNRNYSLLLRKACADSHFSLIKILLQNKNELKIEINAPSSNKKTALDWLEGSKEQPEKQIMIELLLSHDAKSGRIENVPIQNHL